MEIVFVVVFLVIIGVALYLVQQLPIDPTILIAIRVIIVLGVVWYLLALIGMVPYTPFPKFR